MLDYKTIVVLLTVVCYSTYQLTCTDGESSQLTVTTTDLQHTFTDADGILGDTQYACYVAVQYPDGLLSSGSNPAIITVTGGISKYRQCIAECRPLYNYIDSSEICSVCITTQIKSVKQFNWFFFSGVDNVTVNVEDIELTVVYYDFR